MKYAVLLVIIAFFSISPLLAQTTGEVAEQTSAVSDVEELRNASRLPEAAKEAREAGAEEDEIQNVVRGVREEKLTPEEGANTMRIMEENSAGGVSNKGISDFVMEQKAQGVHGKELGQAIKTELQARHQVRIEEGKGKTDKDDQSQEQKATEKEPNEEQPAGTKEPTGK